ncbi:hypothetical protein H7F33_10085 [Pedobacter sp. PAMC26386]|nr:hypothetical protein H7F33_10085 [Pedobacter sp. PAMC26386]
MESLEKAVAYTKKKKSFQIKNSSDSHFDEPLNELHGYLNNQEDDSSVGLNFGYLASWYMWQFVDGYVQRKYLNYDLLVKSTYYSIETNNWDYTLGIIYPTYKSSTQFQYSVMHLGQLLYLGCTDQAKEYGNLLIKMLQGKQYQGGTESPTYPWFIMELFCKWQGVDLGDRQLLSYPKDMGEYTKALTHWNTTDTALLSTIINELCDFHIQQSNEDVTTDEYGNEFSPEFSRSDYFVFPVEILTLLAIRRDLKLPVYHPEHELMRLEINQLPDKMILLQEDELVLQCKAKLKADNPGLIFGLTIIPPPKGNSNRWSILDGGDV